MKDEVIIVKGPEDIAEVIEKLSIDELVFIDIDKVLFENKELTNVNDQEYKVIVDGYQFNILITDDRDWYGLLYVTDVDGKHIYSILSYNVWFWSEGKCGDHTVYIKKEGSNAKIDEE